jgi:uncharacterized protein with HEPN domain
MDRKEGVALRKILDEIDVIEKLVYDFDKERFLTDDRTQRAVAMTLINIGELVKILSLEFRKKHSIVAWRAIAGMRDIVAHKYQSLKMNDIWVTIQSDIPKLKEQLNRIID